MDTNEFINYLRTQKNPEKIAGMENYMRNQFKFLGLQAASRRKLASGYLKALTSQSKMKATQILPKQTVIDWTALKSLWEAPEREFQLIGIDYLKNMESYLVLEDFEPLKQLVLTKSWWDTVDFLSKNIGRLVLKEPELIQVMLDWSRDENLWLRRVSILHQLNHKEHTNTDLLEEIIINNVSDHEFFIRKAIGWALREYAKTNEQWVMQLVARYSEQLSTLSKREALKNIS